MQGFGARLSRRALVGGVVRLGASAMGLTLVNGCGLFPFVAQPRVAHVGFLWTGSPASNHLFAAFRNGLRDAGWVEGQNLVIEIRAYEGRPDLLQEMAAELVALKPEVIATGTAAQALALRRATDSIPIVFAVANDPVGSGLILSFARPGGNVTGTSTSAGPSMGPKKLDLLRQLVPALGRVAVVFEAGSPTDVADLRDIQAAAQANGVDVQTVGIVSLDDREHDLEAALVDQPQALIIPAGGTFPPEHRQAIVAFANQHGLATVGSYGQSLPAALLTYGPDQAELNRRAGNYYVDRILRGVKPADLPVEGPTVFVLAINRTTATALGITIPPDVAAQVTEWI